ncbi:hypothetical protein BDN72DRAFT_811004 [Pluteus cervinus]|uniref:Uncharacterized protein n=1 Tax=Pluteus cervinus TaxID=181527 RepID=A0ACD3BBC5_9AGAR|nr:hypothetical protein BDN72DRAFT_811004 [Pluteus cervinus]
MDTTIPPEEERRWNRLQNLMMNFHGHFKSEFNTLHELADGSYTRRGLSLSNYLRTASRFVHELTMHHTIEEQYFFPMLAKKMPEFSVNSDAAHMISHAGIHRGLDDLTALVRSCQADRTTYSPEKMRECLDSFRDVLFNHLDEEVADLAGENLRKHFTLEELNRLH